MGTVLGTLPLALLAAGLPIFLVLVVASLAGVVVMEVPLNAVPQMMLGSLDKFSLLAVPLFIYAGAVFSAGGISGRLIRWVQAIFGGVRGSLALTTVGTYEFFGAISGSSVATVAAIGKSLYPALRKNGYDERFSLGLITSGGAIASIIPPSIIMIIYGAAAEESVAKLFVGGVLPGITVGLLIAVYVLWYAHAKRVPRVGSFSWGELGRASKESVWALAAPVFILGGIYTGVCTPTESAGIACVYGMIVARFIYRELSWEQLFDIAVDAGILTAQVMIIAAAAGAYSWLLTVSGTPKAVMGFVQAMQLSPWELILALNVLLLIVGCLIDGASAVLILTPLLIPIVRAAGIDPIHFGIILTVNLSIGMFTPPFGLNIFVSQAIFDVSMARIVRGLVPFIGLYLLALALVSYIPQLSLYLVQFVK